ncbi:RHD3/Sey1 [Gorgonomyces haynaldii]|nr:RHD3/Sey1 [Gorgonomyces haynaldii]
MFEIQVVDGDQKFSNELSSVLNEKWELGDKGFQYNVVAVFGSQSTGKSTLLNLLFESQFDVMKETGRQQTTKGIWMCKAKNSSILVMDVEGTDGRERGEDQDFERKSALFSLATSQVLIVNMWENMVGLYNGANMGLLKTVLEVNVNLFQQQGAPKTCLLFVIRDFTGQTPLLKLAETLISDLEKIWASIGKPSAKQDSKLTDFFTFDYVGLPHKIYASQQFQEQVQSLKDRFYNQENPGFLFKPNLHKGIPADGFPHFAEAIWEKIVSNRDLDLPTQQQLLAQYRCDEISKVLLDKFGVLVKTLKTQLEAGKVVDIFGQEAEKWVNDALASFDTDAGRYNPQVFKEKRAEFKSRMFAMLHVYFVLQLRNLHKQALGLFESLFHSLDLEFAEKLDKAQKEAMTKFDVVATHSLLIGSDWSCSEETHAFKQDLDDLVKKKKKEALEQLAKDMDQLLVEKLQEPIQLELNQENPQVWSQIVERFEETVKEAQVYLTDKLNKLGITEELIASSITKTKQQAWQQLLVVVRQELQDSPLLEKLMRAFETKFRYDEKGMPRVWSPSDPVDVLYASAKELGLELLERLCKMQVDETRLKQLLEMDKLDLELVQMTRRIKIQEKFQKQADAFYVDAKRSTVQSRAEIPPWFIILTIVLGWNELMYVIFGILNNPLLITLTVLLLSGGYFLWYTNLYGPFLQVAKVTFQEISKQAMTQVNQAMQKLQKPEEIELNDR